MSIRVMTAVWDNAGVQGSELLVLLALADWADDNGVCWPAMSTLADKARISERSAQRACRSLVEKGLLAIEDNAGPKGANRYRVATEKPAAPATTSCGGGDNLTPPAAAPGGDTADTGGVTPVTPGGDTGDTRTVIEPPVNRQERERAGAQADGGEGGQDVDRSDMPGTADFEKRVMRFCNGRGYDAGAWPDWDTSSPGYINRQMAGLSPDERAESEKWRDPYLLDLKHRGRKPVPPGVFLRDRLWTGLDEAILQRAERLKQAKLAPAERPRPEGWAAAHGPVWSARMHALLLDGPERPERVPGEIPVAAGEALWLANQISAAWPSLAALRSGGGRVLEPRWHALKDAVEFVKADSAIFAAWRDAYADRLWPWPKVPDGMDGLYFPRGGPAGLKDFEDALRGSDAQEAAE